MKLGEKNDREKAHSPAGSRTLVVCGGQRNGQATERADRKVLHVAGVKNKIISREKGRWLSALAVEFSRKDR